MKLSASDIAFSLRDLMIQVEQILSVMRMLSNQIELLDADALPFPTSLATAVPYRSQWDKDGDGFASDCGPACVAMLVEWAGTRLDINQISIEAGMTPNRRFTLPADLIRSAGLHGVTLERRLPCALSDLSREIDIGRPVIALIRYGDLGDLRQDRNYDDGHWVVVVGVNNDSVFIHDPDWQFPRREGGRALPVPRAIFESAWACVKPDGKSDGNTPNQCLMVVPRV